MGAEFTFYDYVDDRGINQIQDWLTGQGANAYSKVDLEIRHMEALPREDWGWGKGIKGPMQGDCDDLYEIRRLDNKRRV